MALSQRRTAVVASDMVLRERRQEGRPMQSEDFIAENTANGNRQGETPQRLRSQLLAREREVVHLRRRLDLEQTSPLSPSPKQHTPKKLQRRTEQCLQKIELALDLIRRGSNSMPTVVDLLNASLRIGRGTGEDEGSSVASPGTVFCDENTSHLMDRILSLERQVAEQEREIRQAVARDHDVENVIQEISEACRISEQASMNAQKELGSARAAKIRAESALRKSESALVESERRLGLAEDRLGHLQAHMIRLQRENSCDRSSTGLDVRDSKIIQLSNDLQEIIVDRDRLQLEVESLDHENIRIKQQVDERDTQIQNLVAKKAGLEETERSQFLKSLQVANAAVSTLELELRLTKRNEKTDDEEEDEEEDEEKDSNFAGIGSKWLRSFTNNVDVVIVEPDDQPEDDDDDETCTDDLQTVLNGLSSNLTSGKRNHQSHTPTNGTCAAYQCAYVDDVVEDNGDGFDDEDGRPISPGHLRAMLSQLSSDLANEDQPHLRRQKHIRQLGSEISDSDSDDKFMASSELDDVIKQLGREMPEPAVDVSRTFLGNMWMHTQHSSGQADDTSTNADANEEQESNDEQDVDVCSVLHDLSVLAAANATDQASPIKIVISPLDDTQGESLTEENSLTKSELSPMFARETEQAVFLRPRPAFGQAERQFVPISDMFKQTK